VGQEDFSMRTSLFYKPRQKCFLLSAEQFAALDREAEQNGLCETVLVENAGRTLAAELLKEIQKAPVARAATIDFAFVIGKGNNGADALVASRYLFDAGYSLKVFVLSETGSTEYQRTLNLIRSVTKVPVVSFGRDDFLREVPRIIVDGLLGTGLNGSLAASSEIGVAVNAINDSKAFVVSVDLPSGLSADVFNADSVKVKADLTITFAGWKYSFLHEESQKYLGTVQCVDVGIPDAIYLRLQSERSFATVHLKPYMWDVSISEFSNKYDRGHVLVLGGSKGKTGAAALCAQAAVRAGAGWVTRGVPDSYLRKADRDRSFTGDVHSHFDVVFEDLVQEDGALKTAEILKFIGERKVKSIVLGPGWMENHLSKPLLESLAKFSCDGGIVVFDAGATHGLVPLAEGLKFNSKTTIALPHPGEWRRLGGTLGESVIDSMESLERVAAEVTRLNGINFVWKSAVPIFLGADPKGPHLINFFPTHRLARAGMGDVLAGLTASYTLRTGHVLLAAAYGHSAMVRAASSFWRREESLLSAEMILDNLRGYL
jgi:ADP-dependent NAD(P)H-hydrate dehydratase / NAD(P)H-hydrate epimerase